MKEVWKQIPNCPGYEASSLGRIRSINRIIKVKNRHGSIEYRNYKKKIISLCKSKYKSGIYHTFGFWKNNKQKLIHVNRAVCVTFHGSPPTKKHQAAHLDGNSQNNNKNNLCWVTQSENELHKIKHGTMRLGENHHYSKLSKKDVLSLLKKHRDGIKAKEIAINLNICPGNVYSILRGRTWKHIDRSV